MKVWCYSSPNIRSATVVEALMIVESEPKGSDLGGVVLHLGGFHTEMNFLGCIEHLIDSSGLQEILESIYAPNAVVYMLDGKAIA